MTARRIVEPAPRMAVNIDALVAQYGLGLEIGSTS
jgi:hypothetical protein